MTGIIDLAKPVKRGTINYDVNGVPRHRRVFVYACPTCGHRVPLLGEPMVDKPEPGEARCIRCLVKEKEESAA